MRLLNAMKERLWRMVEWSVVMAALCLFVARTPQWISPSSGRHARPSAQSGTP